MEEVEIFPLSLDEDIIETDNLEIPPLETPRGSYSEEAAADRAFFAASSSETPVDDFLLAKRQLVEEGESAIVAAAEQRALEETDINAKLSINEMLVDETIPNAVKESVLRTYASGGLVSKSLRNRYIEQSVADDNSTTLADIKQQDNVADSVEEIKFNTLLEEHKEQKTGFLTTLATFGQATGSIASNIASSIFGGYAGIFYLLKDRDAAKADFFVGEVSAIAQEYGYNPEGEDVAKATSDITEVLEKLSIPADWIGEKMLDYTGSPGAATAANILLDPLNFIPVGLLTKGMKFRKGSPAQVISETNKKNASDLFTGAIYDDTGELAKAIGADKGTILQETVLPDLVETGILKENPDIRHLMDIQDAKANYSFNLHKYDPGLVDVAARQADLDLVLDVIKEVGSPYYQQANSVVTSPGINVFEGKAVYGRNATGNYVSPEGAQFAFEKLSERIQHLPPEIRGELEIVKRGNGEFVIEHSWRKDYEPLDDIIFGPDAVNSTFAGIDINNLKHTAVGRWLFSTGVFPRKYESSKGRSVDRAAKQANDINREIKDNITNSKHKKELNTLVNEAEATGKEYFSRKEIAGKFPNLSTTQVDDLFTSHIMWRRVAHYEHRILNNMRRNEMLNKNYKTMYDDNGKQVTNVSTFIEPKEITSNSIKQVIDLEGGSVRDAGELTIRDSDHVVDATGKQVVRLYEPVIDANGNRYNYGIMSGKHTTGALSAQVLPRISGWSPRRHLNHFYIDSIPKAIRIDGNDITDPLVLREHRKALAGAKTQFEADEIAANLQAKHPDREVVVRQDRIESEEAILNDYTANTELYAQSRKRGEGLANTQIEDRLKTLMDTATSLSRANTSAAWEQATQKSFIKSYGSKSQDNILRSDKFPNSKEDIIRKPNMTKEEKANYQSAVALLDNYTRFKEFSYTADKVWSSGLHFIADKLESIKLPANLVRDLSKINNPAVSFPKKLGSFLYINTNVPRQWFIQPTQMAELVAIHPLSAPQTFADLGRMSMHLLGDWEKTGSFGKVTKWASKKMPGTDEQVIKSYVQAIRDSGIIDSIDTNVLVHGIFHDSNKLITTPGDKARTAATALPSTASKLGRSLGYDPAEIVNKMGIWLQMRNKWERNNPGENWNTPEVRDSLAHDVHLYSGNMNKAGNLPYQAGMLSPLFQFSAIGHKQFMNFFQNTATPLTAAERTRLGAVRAVMMGAKYGIPGGGLMYAVIDEYGDADTKQNAEVVKEGIADILINEYLNTVFPDEKGQTQLGVSRSISPLGESGIPYADQIIHTMAFLDDDTATHARFPLFGVSNSMYKISKQWEQLWYSNEYDTKEKFDLGLRQAVVAASGFNNWFKAMTIIGSGEKMNRLGNPNGLYYTQPEGWATFIGVHSDKDEWAFDQIRKFRDNDKNIDNTAKDIFTYVSALENMGNPDGTPVEKMKAMAHALDVAVSNEYFTEDAKTQILTKVLQMSTRDDNLTNSVIRNWVLKETLLPEENKKKMLITLKRDKSPEIQALVKAIEERNY